MNYFDVVKSLIVLVQSDLHTGMSGASVGRNLSIEVILDHDNLLTAIRIGFQDPLNRRVCHLTLSTGNMPPKKQNSLA